MQFNINQYTYGSESISLISLANDPSISPSDYASILSNLISSNVYYFYKLFGKRFLQWLSWLENQQTATYYELLENSYESEVSFYLDLYAIDRDNIEQQISKLNLLSKLKMPFLMQRIEIFISEAIKSSFDSLGKYLSRISIIPITTHVRFHK
ncbi:hypothetical protein HDV04_002059 [Boothiomyces sp. JEL0838]|nr:hypothetical protein HDV04_002059 [Boothiomyces sp. JEL0838]